MKNSLFALILALVFAACASSERLNQLVLSPEQSSKKGFTAEQGSTLKNPASGKTRIYAIRQNAEQGKDIAYPLYYQYEPTIENGELTIEELDENATIGVLKNGTSYSRDLDAGKPLLLFTGKDSFTSYVVFTPEADKIYCVRASVQNESGLYDNLNLELVDKKRCEKLFGK